MKTLSTIPALLVATAIGMSGAWAANMGNPTPAVTLTEAGQKLETEYAGKLASLQYKEGTDPL